MRRILNFRPLFIIALIMAASIVTSLVAINIMPLGAALFSIIGLIIIAIFIYAIYKRDSIKIITAVLAFVLSALVVVMFFAALESSRSPEVTGAEVYITGRVTGYHFIDDDDRLIVRLDELSIGGLSAAEAGVREADSALNGRLMSVYVENGADYDYIQCGYVVGINAIVYARQLVDGFAVDSSMVRTEVYYAAYVDELTVLAPGRPMGLEAFRAQIYTTLSNNMDASAAAVSYGMIMGDRHYLDEETAFAVSSSGIGHLLAVSGLHIGVLAGAINKLLKLCRAPRVLVPFIIISLLVLYAVMTGFSPSILRAIIMAAISLTSRLISGKADTLNSLGGAACICLLISPYFLFEIGFVMSFSCIFAIATMLPIIRRGLMRIKMPRRIADFLGLSLAVQFAVIPSTIYFFHTFNAYAILANLIIMPFASIFFVALLVAVLLAMLLPFMWWALFAVGLMFGLVVSGSAFVASLPFSHIVMHSSALIFLTQPLIFASGNMLIIKRRKLKVAISFVCLLAIALLPLMTSNAFASPNHMIALTNGDTYLRVKGPDGDYENYVIGDFTSPNPASALLNARISDNLFLYVCNMTENSAKGILKLAQTYNISGITIRNSPKVTGLKTLLDNGYNPTLTYSDGIFTASADHANGWLYRTSASENLIISTSYLDGTDTLSANLVRSRTVTEINPSKTYFLTFDLFSSDSLSIHTTAKSGNIVYSLSDRTIA